MFQFAHEDKYLFLLEKYIYKGGSQTRPRVMIWKLEF